MTWRENPERLINEIAHARLQFSLACHSRFVQEFIHNARFRSILGFGNQFNSPDDLRVELVYLGHGIEARSARSIAPTSMR